MNLIYTVMKYIASDKWVPRARVIWLTSAGYPVCLIYYPSSITSIHSKHPSSGLTYTQPMDCKPVWYWILGNICIFIISHHCIDNRIRNHSSCKIRTCVSRTLSVIADTRTQDIISHGIDQDIQNIPVLATEGLTHWGRDKWTPFSRRHFQIHFCEWKWMNSN